MAGLSLSTELEDRLRFRIALADRLGDQKIDLIVSADDSDPMVRIAHESGIPL